MATILGTPLQLSTQIIQGANLSTTTATGVSALYQGNGAGDQPDGSSFLYYESQEGGNAEFYAILPSSITDTTDTITHIDLRLNGVCFAMRNNVANWENSDRMFAYLALREIPDPSGPIPTFPPNMIWTSGSSSWRNWLYANITDAQIDATKQFFTPNYQADSNGLTEPFPIATSSPHTYSTFDDSALQTHQTFSLALADMGGWNGKFNSGSAYHLVMLIRTNTDDYGGGGEFGIGWETADVKVYKQDDTTTAVVQRTQPDTLTLSTAVSVDAGTTVQTYATDRFTQTGVRRPWTSIAQIYKGRGSFDDVADTESLGKVSKKYNIFPYTVRGLTGDGGVNRGSGIPTHETLDTVDINDIGYNATISKITVEVDIDNDTVATALFGSSGYSGSAYGGYIACNIRFNNTNTNYTQADSGVTIVGGLRQASTEGSQEIPTTGKQTFTFTFYNSGDPLEFIATISPSLTYKNVTPNNIQSYYGSNGIYFGIQLIHEGHGTLGSEAGPDSGMLRDVEDVRVYIEYTGRTNLTTGLIKWGEDNFPGLNISGSSDYEGKPGAKAMLLALTDSPSYITNLVPETRGLFYGSEPRDSVSSSANTVSGWSADGSVSGTWGYNNPWLLNSTNTLDTDYDTITFGSSTDFSEKVFNLGYRPLFHSGNIDISTAHTLTATPVMIQTVITSDLDINTAFTIPTIYAGFLLHEHTISPTIHLNTTLGLAGKIITGFTVAMATSFTANFDGDLAITGVPTTALDTTVSIDINNSGVIHQVTTTTPALIDHTITFTSGIAGVIMDMPQSSVGTLATSLSTTDVSDISLIQAPDRVRLYELAERTRTFTHDAEVRTLTMDTQNRTFIHDAEVRTVSMPTQTRILSPEGYSE